MNFFLYTIFILSFYIIKYNYGVAYITAEIPSDCLTSDKNDPKEFYDISQFQCQKCSQKSEIQTISTDGSCINLY